MKIKTALIGILLVFMVYGMAFASTFVDDSGNTIVVKKPFKRIISLYAAHSENLISLGAEKQLIGVSRHETFPPAVLSKPVFSYHDDLEKFLQAQPDLVLIRPMIYRGFKDLIDRLKDSGIQVVSLQPTTVQEMFDYWKKLGSLTGREREASQMIKRFKKRLSEIDRIVAKIPTSERKRVYFEAIHKRMKTFSPKSIAIFALTRAGGINVAKDAKPVRNSNIAEYGKEKILSHATEIDVYLAQRGAMNRTSVNIIKNEPGFEAIKSIRDGRIYIIDESIVSRPTLRVLEGIFEIGRFLYPAYFNNVDKFRHCNPLTRSDYSELFINFFNLPLETPSYRTIRSAMKKGGIHWYGGFKDVNYSEFRYKFIETAVSLGIFPSVDPVRFFPGAPLTRAELAYSISRFCQLPVAKDISIADVGNNSCCENAIRRAVQAGVMKLDSRRRFYPKKQVSGMDAIEVLKKVSRVAGSSCCMKRLRGVKVHF